MRPLETAHFEDKLCEADFYEPPPGEVVDERDCKHWADFWGILYG